MGTGYKLTAGTKTQNNEMKPPKRNDQNKLDHQNDQNETAEATETAKRVA